MSAIAITLVRHGRQNAGFGADADPGLDPVGEEQARAMAGLIGPSDGRRLVVSPLRRARLTAAALEAAWGIAAEVEPRIAEVPTRGLSLAERGAWLRPFLQGRWSDQPNHLRAWRRGLHDYFAAVTAPGVFVTHFVVINALIGLVTDSDLVTPTMPDHCSINRFALDGGHLRLVETGAQARTVIG
ncbi:histidine phosphatase family protein [Zavarzinia compransoris]|uniref:histidine phosphatase family protein n=1 Tax=Zavarzinia compransoris TaxID=1264899 RepID=UPI0010E13D86|nr:histidine phosphatase family protein [Zavarzinia compransoris]TDP48112.1 broad specificity phosphatase PhoE [Zavarzinia compransoris]